MGNLKYYTNELMYEIETLTDIENRLVVAEGQGKLGKDGLGVWVQQTQIIYRERIKKGLLYSTGNYIQYPVINHNGKNMKKNIYLSI